MRKVETAMGVLTATVAIIAATLFMLGLYHVITTVRTAPSPSGVWAGLVDDLPSGRVVECVFARDPSGAVAVTCDWANAVRAP